MKYMKINHIVKTAFVVAAGVLSLTSCEDFLTIYPTDKKVGEDFWKKKSDVEQSVAAAYAAVLSGSVQERAIMWGAFRSDELVKTSSRSDTDMDNISVVNLLPTQGICNWNCFYSVINRCNLVLAHAPQVVEDDPDFSNGDYETMRAQMLALRSFCYFYLVRSFRDVPYTELAFENDDMEREIAQSTPAAVLDSCIKDLQDAEAGILKSTAYQYGDWRNKGYFTRDAVQALLADIYLWRGSMTQSAADYQKCVDYADKVIKSKDDYYHTLFPNEINVENKSDIYHLASRANQFYTIFRAGNSWESILEWQYDGDKNSNETLERLYSRDGDNSNTPRVMASNIFNTTSSDAVTGGQKVYFTKDDYRFWNFAYEVSPTSGEAIEVPVRKMVDTYNNITQVTANNGAPKGARAFNNYRQNWIVYRLSDVMLMKAEALVQLAKDNEDASLENAFNLVQFVNKRSLERNSTDTLKFNSYKSKTLMEQLVLAERERELCFEGKRWYDLMRYSYRHMSGVNINQLMSDNDFFAPQLYRPMVELMCRKSTNGSQAVSAKMRDERYLYWPINEGELKVNTLLNAHPVFISVKSSSKN